MATTSNNSTTAPAAKQNLDWSNLSFGYMETDYSYSSIYQDGAWDEGHLTKDHSITLSECACIFHYCQECFEGLKAYTTQDGSVVCFRPDLNAERMVDSARRLVMPPFPKERFIDAVKQVVEANASWVPPFGSGASLYVRPFMIGSGEVIGVKPADRYEFRILVTPVGPYFKGGLKPIKLCVSSFDRAAPRGTGAYKVGLNYAMSLYSGVKAHADGFADNLYLDAETRTYVEETSGANVLLSDGKKLVVPQSATDSILPSITRRSLVKVAQDLLGMEVEERMVRYDELQDFSECGLCGTAAVISPVGEITDQAEGKTIYFKGGHDEMGPVMTKLRETLTGIQEGSLDDPFGWVYKIC